MNSAQARNLYNGEFARHYTAKNYKHSCRDKMMLIMFSITYMYSLKPGFI